MSGFNQSARRVCKERRKFVLFIGNYGSCAILSEQYRWFSSALSDRSCSLRSGLRFIRAAAEPKRNAGCYGLSCQFHEVDLVKGSCVGWKQRCETPLWFSAEHARGATVLITLIWVIAFLQELKAMAGVLLFKTVFLRR
ncbi:hypothetical protein AVEN_153438-1 [Araneus ventricosus]|uniref:Uncharacterized protein n=1 Tax=Araneus ventricosus TaxID=182803 RepID=A0A4Y2GLW9_ARAVE|nr:hypothetical protein AVEN_153438-1 [Araneus ventricosus]